MARILPLTFGRIYGIIFLQTDNGVIILKKSISVLLSLLTILLTFSISAYAMEDNGEYFYYHTEQGIVLSYCSKEPVGVVIVPKEIDNRPVIGFALDCFTSKHQMTEIILPETMLWLEDGAFINCTNLKRIVLPKKMADTNGGNYFQDCTSLTDIVLPENLVTISYATFKNCISLQEIELPESIKFIQFSAFENCCSLKEISIPENTIKIEEKAFYNCTNLKKIIINNKDCEIFDSEDTIPENTVIYGYLNSTAQKYAEKYNRKFIGLDYGEFSNFLFKLMNLVSSFMNFVKYLFNFNI